MDLGFPTDYAHLSEYGLNVDQFPAFKEAATRIAAAYNRSIGISWAAYSTYAGASSNVYIVILLRSLDQLDEIPSVDEVLLNEYGDASRVFLRDYQQAITRVSTSIIAHVPSARGRDLKWGPEMPPYLYYSKFTVRVGELAHFQRASEKIALAHREHRDGLPWYTYSTLAGDPVVHWLLPLHKLGELRLVQSTTQILLDVHGPKEGAAVLDQFQHSLGESRSSVLQYLGHYFGEA
jgi:hypothetical protein